jgi:hypothetical protein
MVGGGEGVIVFLHASPSYKHGGFGRRCLHRAAFAAALESFPLVLHTGDAATAAILPDLAAEGFRAKLWMKEPEGYDLEPWDACDMVILLADRSDFQPGKVAMRGLLDQAMRKGKNVQVIFGD